MSSPAAENGPAESPAEYFSIGALWPHRDAVVTALRYILAGEFVGGGKVLDMGCGGGDGAVLLAPAVRRYVGLDRLPHWRQNPRPRPENVRFIEGDMLEPLPKREGRFGAVVALEVIEHIGDAQAFRRAVQGAVTPGGTIVVSTPNFNLLSRRFGGSRRPLFEHHVREFTAAGFKRHLASYGEEFALFGLSQLADERENAARITCAFGDRIYRLAVGRRFPEIEVAQIEVMSAPIPLRYSQGFFAVVGPRRRPAGLPRVTAGSRITPESAALRSVEWVLRRRNEHVWELQEGVVHRDIHIGQLEARLAERGE